MTPDPEAPAEAPTQPEAEAPRQAALFDHLPDDDMPQEFSFRADDKTDFASETSQAEADDAPADPAPESADADGAQDTTDARTASLRDIVGKLERLRDTMRSQ